MYFNISLQRTYGNILTAARDINNIIHRHGIYGVKNIGRRTQFCDPFKKKNGMNSLESIFWKKGTKGMYHNSSNNLEATFVKLSEKHSIIHCGIYWCLATIRLKFCFATVTVKRAKKSFRY